MTLASSIAPWLSVRDGERAIAFYQAAFGAKDVYRFGTPMEGIVARLSIDGAEFWISADASESAGSTAEPLGGGTVRMILTVSDPEAVFARAVASGATVVFPVGEDHGWRLGRLIDPFGLHWEIGHPLA